MPSGPTFYSWIDLETGGLNPITNPIFQLACVITDVERLDVISQYSTYIKVPETLPVLSDDDCKNYNLGMCLSSKAMEINGLNPSQNRIAYAPSELKMMTILQLMLDEYRGAISFAGYNYEFDQRFLTAASQRTGIFPQFSGAGFDVYSQARSRFRPHQLRDGKYKLVNVAAALGVDTANAHDALTDIMMTIEVARRMR